ncbi:GNAT family N-acetyltransferase [Nocardia jejuensis]|uniref:GNAT family N-acetyltransferase n=1 Tax=Nocardia jejuensis TaxID=328049 RepID=UPI00082FA9F4|nr:GNAT family N-acetyltransferase [Nocardia jejuensis]
MTVLETERLRLRPWTASESDIALWMGLHTDSEVTEFLGSYNWESTVERLTAMEKLWTTRGHGQFVVESRADGRFLGRAGLNYWPQFDEVEAAWTFRREAWGNGYATEAAKGFLEWGFRTLPVPYIAAMIHPDNLRSKRVALRLGFTVLRSDILNKHPVIVHALYRPES